MGYEKNEVKDEEMRFISFIKPALTEGKYSVSVKQSVNQPEKHDFENESVFYVETSPLALKKEDVFSVFPAENECGEFQNNLPFLVLENRTYPWEKEVCAEVSGVPVPWVALIVVAENEGSAESDVPVSELVSGINRGVFGTGQPKFVGDNEPQMCHVLDLPAQLYRDIMPSLSDLPLLCHARSVNLSKTEDAICAKDGFFSVICANRFVPSGGDKAVKSTVHLVSMAGHIGAEIPQGVEMVRLISLYRWDIYSKQKSDEAFSDVIERLKNNCGIMNYDAKTEPQKLGYCAKKHITRTGEQTYSLYRSPLLPFRNTENLDTGSKHTADGLLIYDKQSGVLDVTYSAAWQLGRLYALNNQSVSAVVLRHRKAQKLKLHRRMLQESMDYKQYGIDRLAVRLVRENIL